MPPIVRRLIAAHLHSIEQVEVLLLLRRRSPSVWPVRPSAASCAARRASVLQRLVDLEASGLIERAEGGEGWRFPAHHPARETVRLLADAYRIRPYAVMALVTRSRTSLRGRLIDAVRPPRNDNGR